MYRADMLSTCISLLRSKEVDHAGCNYNHSELEHRLAVQQSHIKAI